MNYFIIIKTIFFLFISIQATAQDKIIKNEKTKKEVIKLNEVIVTAKNSPSVAFLFVDIIKNNYQFEHEQGKCAGVFIHKNILLTDAHCVKFFLPERLNSLRVALGNRVNFSPHRNNQINHGLIEKNRIVYHHRYDVETLVSHSNTIRKHDLAMINLQGLELENPNGEYIPIKIFNGSRRKIVRKKTLHGIMFMQDQDEPYSFFQKKYQLNLTKGYDAYWADNKYFSRMEEKSLTPLSGGPVYYKNKLIGLITNSLNNDEIMFIDLAMYEGWIKETLKYFKIKEYELFTNKL